MVWIVGRASRVKGPGGADIGVADFPNFNSYLQGFNRVLREPRIWDAFKKWSGLNSALAQMSASYGSAPAIDFLPLSATHYGEFKPSYSHRIWIRIDKVRSYENHQRYNDGKYLQKLILHEMVHWGRHIAHLDDADRGGCVDNGDRFENDAYTNPYQPWL
jgi:hypothetical protein